MGVINRGLSTLPLVFRGPHFGSQRTSFPGVTEVTPVSVVSGGPGLLDAFSAGRGASVFLAVGCSTLGTVAGVNR